LLKKRNVGKFQHKIAAAEEIIIPCLSPQINFLTSKEKLFILKNTTTSNLKTRIELYLNMGKKWAKSSDRPKSRMLERREDFLLECCDRDMNYILEKVILSLPKKAVLNCMQVSTGWKEMVLSF
jgi:hypothetical protein